MKKKVIKTKEESKVYKKDYKEENKMIKRKQKRVTLTEYYKENNVDKKVVLVDDPQYWYNIPSIEKEGEVIINLPVKSCYEVETNSNYYRKFVLTVRCKDLVPFPLDGNPRELDMKSKGFLGAVTTLKVDGNFDERNSGLVVFTNHFSPSKVGNFVSFRFTNTLMGMVNGGSSMSGILCANHMGFTSENQLCTIIVHDYKTDNFTKFVKKEISKSIMAKNNSQDIKPTDKATLVGADNPYRELISEENNKLFANKTTSAKTYHIYSFDMLPKMLHIMDRREYYTLIDNKINVPSFVNNGNKKFMDGIVEKGCFFEDDLRKNLRYFKYIANDIVRLNGKVLYEFDRGHEGDAFILELMSTPDKEFMTPYSAKFSGYNRKGHLGAEVHSWALLAAFSANIYTDSKGYARFRVNIDKLFSCVISELMEKLYECHKSPEYCNGDKKNFVSTPSCWIALFEVVERKVKELEGK